MNLTIGYKNFSFVPAEAPELAPAELISYATSKCALGHVLVAGSGKAVCAILMGDDRTYLEADLAAAFPDAALMANLAAVEEDLAKALHFLEMAFISRSTSAARPSSAMSGRSCARSRSGGP
jgi:hypothetical protein